MIEIFAPAKLNLHLHVTGKRSDGYHLLDSLVVFADIGDWLSFEEADKFEIFIEGEFASFFPPAEKLNSIAQAAQLLSERLQRKANVKIKLTKNLPIGAGIGGGSADAAACVRGLCEFWGAALGENELAEIALKIGSDVPVCLNSKPVLMQGIGDVILPAPKLPEMAVLLIWPDQIAATPEVFRNARLEHFSSPTEFKAIYEDVASLLTDLKKTKNDLYVSATELFPVIQQAMASLKKEDDCLFAHMSGSGSTVFGLFETIADAERAGEKIRHLHPNWWVKSGKII